MFIGVCPLSSSWVILSTNSRTANYVQCFDLSTIGCFDGSGRITGRRLPFLKKIETVGRIEIGR